MFSKMTPFNVFINCDNINNSCTTNLNNLPTTINAYTTYNFSEISMLELIEFVQDTEHNNLYKFIFHVGHLA